MPPQMQMPGYVNDTKRMKKMVQPKLLEKFDEEMTKR